MATIDDVEAAGKKNEISEKLPVIRAVVDVLVLAFTWFGVSNILRLIGPYERGFFCDDETIRLPFKPNTVSGFALFSFCLVVPMLTVLGTELIRLMNQATSTECYSKYECGRKRSARLAIRFCLFYFYFLLAFVSTNVFTGVVKYSVARLRPHFLDACMVNMNLGNCSALGHKLEYITDYHCLNEDPLRLRDIRLSFWSGHSALSMCASTYSVLYLQSRLRGLFESLVSVPLLQVALLSSGMFISYSRISDHMHHSSDVLVGMFVGILIASISVFHFAELEMASEKKKKRSKTANVQQAEGNSTDIPFASNSNSNASSELPPVPATQSPQPANRGDVRQNGEH